MEYRSILENVRKHISLDEKRTKLFHFDAAFL